MLSRQKKKKKIQNAFSSLLKRSFFFTKQKDNFLLKAFIRRKTQEPDKNILNSHY